MTAGKDRASGADLLHMREQWRTGAAFALAPPLALAFGRRKKRWRTTALVVALADEPLSRRWWRGAATLSLLCAGLAAIAPYPFEPLPAAPLGRVGAAEAEQYRQIAIAPLDSGSDTGGRM